MTCTDPDEKDTMIIPEAPRAREAPRSAHAQLSRKRNVTVVTTLLLAAAFILAGAPTTTVESAALAFGNNHVTSITDLASAPCRGKKPGICRNSSAVQPDDFGQVSGGQDRNAESGESDASEN